MGFFYAFQVICCLTVTASGVKLRINSIVLATKRYGTKESKTDGGLAMNRFEQLRDFVMGLEADFKKFYEKGNKAAGTRVRKAMQDLKKLAQEIRLEIQEKKNQM